MDWTDVEWAEVYSVGTDNVPAIGYFLSDRDAAALASPIQAILADTKGTEEVLSSLRAIISTEFESHRLREVLAVASDSVDEWRAGEAIAENHLAIKESCCFPWPSSRDLKNPGTSSGGVDLVGFNVADNKAAFALAEIKTSRQVRHPPSVMASRHGLEAQLEGLKNNDDRKKWAIRYLGLHAQGKSWFVHYLHAMTRYLSEPNDVRLYGTLVHVTSANELDLKTRALNLGKDCPASTRIKLSAIYVSADGLTAMAGREVAWETSSGSE